MPDFIPPVGSRVHLFYMLGDGSYGTIGTVKAADGDKVQIEETEYEHWDWNESTKTGKHVPVPFKCSRWQSSATRWFECQRENHPLYNMFKVIDPGPGDNVGIELLSEYEARCKEIEREDSMEKTDQSPKVKAVEAIVWSGVALKVLLTILVFCFIGALALYIYLNR